jgi:hypothetical protein
LTSDLVAPLGVVSLGARLGRSHAVRRGDCYASFHRDVTWNASAAPDGGELTFFPIIKVRQSDQGCREYAGACLLAA